MGIPNNRTAATSAFVEASTSGANVLLNLLMLFVVLAGGVGFFCGLSLENKLKPGLGTPLHHSLANPDDAFPFVAPGRD